MEAAPNSHLNHSSYLQIATVASNGRPSNRTVVFRGFQDDGRKIQINTDSRTHKIDDLKHCPFAEICWYFTNSWEQFRIGGQVDVIDGTNSDPVKLQQREKCWFACSLKSRMQYLAPAPRLLSASEQHPTETPTLDSSMGPVGVFCLLVLNPDQVDYLNLKSNERLIFTARQDGSGETHWSVEKELSANMHNDTERVSVGFAIFWSSSRDTTRRSDGFSIMSFATRYSVMGHV